MAVVALTSLSGSPGVTTTAVAWATISANPTLLLEADLTGGSPILAGRLRAQIPHERSLLALTTYEYGTPVPEILREQSLPLPGAVSESALVVPGIAEGSQATALAASWPQVGRALQDISSSQGVDVVVDLGRMTANHPAWAMVEQLDQILVLSRATLPGLIALRNNLGSIASRIKAPALGVVLVDQPLESFGAREAEKVLNPVPVIATLSHNPKAAATYYQGWPLAAKRRLKSYHQQIQQLQAASSDQRAAHHKMLTGETA